MRDIQKTQKSHSYVWKEVGHGQGQETGGGGGGMSIAAVKVRAPSPRLKPRALPCEGVATDKCWQQAPLFTRPD